MRISSYHCPHEINNVLASQSLSKFNTPTAMFKAMNSWHCSLISANKLLSCCFMVLHFCNKLFSEIAFLQVHERTDVGRGVNRVYCDQTNMYCWPTIVGCPIWSLCIQCGNGANLQQCRGGNVQIIKGKLSRFRY